MITAVISKKGGVGKTTTSVHLAAALARSLRRVLMIDLDPNAGASASWGLRKQDRVPSVADLLFDDKPLRKVMRRVRVRRPQTRPGVPAGHAYVDIIPASVDLRSAGQRLGRNARALERALGSFVRNYDHVLIDCPASLDFLTRLALYTCDHVLVPTMVDYLSLEGLPQLRDHVSRFSWRERRPIHFLGFVLTMVDYRRGSTRRSIRGLREQLGNEIFAVEIRTNSVLAEAPERGRPVYDFAASSTGAHSYTLLAEELELRAGQAARLAESKTEEVAEPKAASGLQTRVG